MPYSFDATTAGRPNLAKRNTAPSPVTLLQLPSLEALPTPHKDRARRAASQSHLPSLEDSSIKPQSIFQKLRSKRPQSSLTAMPPLLKSRRPSSPKEQTSFFHFDLTAMVTAFELRPKATRTNTSRSTKNESMPSSLLPGESFTPFSTPSNTYSMPSLAALPSIQHVMDAYDITHSKNSMYQEKQQERVSKEQKKKKRETIKLPMMKPPPKLSNYCSKREELEILDGDDWEYDFLRDISTSLTQPPTPTVPTHSHNHRQRNYSIPVALDYTIRIPASQRDPRSPNIRSHNSGSFEQDIGSFGTDRSHDIWLQNQVDTLEEVERGAVRELEQMSGRLMTDGWGYGNGSASCRASGRANRASQPELPVTHSPLPPEPLTAPILVTETPTPQPQKHVSEHDQTDKFRQRERSHIQGSNIISVPRARPVSEQRPPTKELLSTSPNVYSPVGRVGSSNSLGGGGHGGSASAKVEREDKRCGSFTMYANTNIPLPPAPPPPTGVPLPAPPIGGVCVSQQVPLYLAGADEKVEWSSGASAGAGVVGVKNQFKVSENDRPVEVTYEVLTNTRATLGLAAAAVIAPPPIPPRSAERGYSGRKEIKRTTSNSYPVTHHAAHAIATAEPLHQQTTSSSIHDSQHDKLASVDGQGETKEQKGKLQTDGTAVNGLSLGMLKPKRASTGGKKRGDRDILLPKRQDSGSSAQSQPIQKRPLPPIPIQPSSPGTSLISKHRRRPSTAPVPAPVYFSSPRSTDSHSHSNSNSNPITPEKPRRLLPRDEPRLSLSPSSSTHTRDESFSHDRDRDRERKKVRQDLFAMGFLALDEMYLRQSLALAQQPPTPPMPSKIAFGAMGAAKGMVKGLKARVSNAPSMVSHSGFVTTPPTHKVNGQKRESSAPQRKEGGAREEGDSLDFSVNDNEGWSRPTSAEAVYIMPPAERSKIGSHEVDKKRSRHQSRGAEKAKQQKGEGIEDEFQGEFGSGSSVPGSEERSGEEGETSIGMISLWGHGKEGRKEEWHTVKEYDSTKHLSLKLAQGRQAAQTMLFSLPTGTATHTKARPPPIDVSSATIDGWKIKEIEKRGHRPSLLPPPRPRRMTASGQGRGGSTESSKGRPVSPLDGVVDKRNTFFNLSRPSKPVIPDAAYSPLIQTPAQAVAQNYFPFIPANIIHTSAHDIPRRPSDHASEHHQHLPQRQGQAHPFLPYSTPTTPKSKPRPHTSNSAHHSFTSLSLTLSSISAASDSTADKEKEEKERQRKLLMSAWLASKPVRRSKQEQAGETAPAALGGGGTAGEVRKEGRPGTISAGMGMKRDEDAGSAYRRASLDNRRF